MTNEDGAARRTRSARRATAAGVVAAAAVALAMVLSGWGGSSARSDATAQKSPQRGPATPAQRDKKTLVIGVSSDPQTLDPEYGQAKRANETIKNIYAQWVRYDTKDSGRGYRIADVTKVVPEATSLKVLSKGRVRLTARNKARFPSGKTITADDLLFKVRRALGVNVGSVFDFNILGITKLSQVRKINSRTIELRLPKASPILGPMLRDQDAGLVDTTNLKRRMNSADKWGHGWLARTGGAATGAYVVDTYTPGTRLVLKPNPNYWGPKPYFTTVILQVIPSAQNRILLLRNGTIDIAEDLSLDDANRLKGQRGINLISVPSVNQDLLGFVLDKKPFDDRRVRQAIAYAVPYNDLVNGVLRGQAKVAKGVWPQNSVWFQKKASWPYKQDTAKARALLQQAGYTNNLSFTVEISDGDADAQALAIPLQTALRRVGVTMEIRKLSAAQFQSNLGSRSMQAWISTNLGSFVDDPYYHIFLWYGTTSVINWFKYSNPVVDAANKRFSGVLKKSQRSALALQVQQQLNRDVPAISLGEPNFLLPMRSDIGGFLYEPDGLLTYRLLTRR